MTINLKRRREIAQEAKEFAEAYRRGYARADNCNYSEQEQVWIMQQAYRLSANRFNRDFSRTRNLVE